MSVYSGTAQGQGREHPVQTDPAGTYCYAGNSSKDRNKRCGPPCDMQYGYDYLRNMIHISDFTYINRHADPVGSGWIEVKEGLYAHLVPAMSKGV